MMPCVHIRLEEGRDAEPRVIIVGRQSLQTAGKGARNYVDIELIEPF